MLHIDVLISTAMYSNRVTEEGLLETMTKWEKYEKEMESVKEKILFK